MGIKYGTGNWDNTALGNHRAVVTVNAAAEAVKAHIEWRRRDADIDKKNILVYSESTGERVNNLLGLNISREFGELIFQADNPGNYFVYYMPWRFEPEPGKSPDHWGWNSYFQNIGYFPVEDTADISWKERVTANHEHLQTAELTEIQSINEFHSFYPMEVIATSEETDKLLADNKEKPYIVFVEDRKYPIRMFNELPQRWIEKGITNIFEGNACRNEYYAFQIGIYGSAKDLENIEIQFSDAKGPCGSIIPKEAFNCVNLRGTDWVGRQVVKKVDVAKGAIQPLWCGVHIPENAKPGLYECELSVMASNAPTSKIKIKLNVADEFLEDGGENELWRQSRLSWLNSTAFIDNEVFKPYIPVTIEDTTVSVLGRKMKFGEDGLPASITSSFSKNVDRIDSKPVEILASPMEFVIETARGAVNFSGAGAKPRVINHTSGMVEWESQSKAEGWTLTCRARMECDGYIDYSLMLNSDRKQDVKDISLNIYINRSAAKYMMGMGHKGGYAPKELKWGWDIKKCNHQFWIGDTNAGLQCRLKHAVEDWTVIDMERTGPYRDWSNEGKGGAYYSEIDDKTVCMKVFTGEKSVDAGEELKFNLGFLITPVKILDKNHWQWKYVQRSLQVKSAREEFDNGVKIINVHQGTPLNPYINYPFCNERDMRAYADEIHKYGMKFKIYYTLRELSYMTSEMWILRSLKGEVFTDGAGISDTDKRMKQPPYRTHTGCSWICEHLVDGYRGAWHEPATDDAAIETVGLSRWHNYYIEGLRWMLQNVPIDGLYLDGIGYDREVMKRVRKAMDRTREGSLADFHAGNMFSNDFGMTNTLCLYAEHLPFIDSLWYGEGWDYSQLPPEYWLVELSGIPFGLFGEMLGEGSNLWMGMLYGMASRFVWAGAPDPRQIWKLWDDFGIAEADMIGFWDDNCPIKTDNDNVHVTVYKKKDKVLIAMANWSDNDIQVHLKIDYAALGLDSEKIILTAREIKDFQPASEFYAHSIIPVQKKKGWLLEAAMIK